ncbi:MAG: methyltransferase [Spongiibacteraceae bacterium]
MLRRLVVLVVLLVSSSTLLATESLTTALQQAATGEHRSPENIARNQYRHPVKTLEFFGLKAEMTVIEINPGGMWYTEVLAPVLSERGQYIAAGYDMMRDDLPGYQIQQNKMLQQRFATESVFGKAKIIGFSPATKAPLGEPASADMVLTFRNTHGWVRDGVAGNAYKAFFDVLKPGGVLGVVQHRGPAVNSGFTGYLTEQQVVDIAQAAGFELDARSEINANPKDTKDYSANVWALPPVLRMGEVDREKHLAIGESDRMTLRFRKPE